MASLKSQDQQHKSPINQALDIVHTVYIYVFFFSTCLCACVVSIYSTIVIVCGKQMNNRATHSLEYVLKWDHLLKTYEIDRSKYSRCPGIEFNKNIVSTMFKAH